MPDQSEKAAPKPLRKRIEDNILVVLFSCCAATATVVAGAGAYVADSAIQAERSDARVRLSEEVMRLANVQQDALGELSQSFEEERDAHKSALRELNDRIQKVEAENAQLRSASAAFVACRESGSCDRFFLQDRLRRVLDVDAVVAREPVFPIYSGRILAPRPSPPDVIHRELAFGQMQQFMLDESVDLDETPDEEPLFVEHVWQIGDTQDIGGHPRLKRFASFFSIYRTPIAQGTRGEEMDAVWSAFNNDLERRNAAQDLRGMRPRLRQVEGMGTGALFAHYQTVLRDVELDGAARQRLFMNEMIFYVRGSGEGGEVFVIRCSFLSERRRVEDATDWVRVIDWWTKLIINTG
ncbi:MAG: hypothetical protein AAGE18_00305 [Pseudomonadota bacterium]